MEEKDGNVSWYKTRLMGTRPVMEGLLKWKDALTLTLEPTGFLKCTVPSMKQDQEKDGVGETRKGKIDNTANMRVPTGLRT